MASFNGFVLTNKGRELLAKAVAGEQLTFTKMEVGDGTFTGDIRTLTALVNKKDDFSINQIENQGNGQVSLKAIISNKNTTIGYYIKEIGMFAHGADNIEILYAYNKAIEADYFPAFNGSNAVEVEYQNIIIVDQAQNVTAVIDPSLTYLTKEEAADTYLENKKMCEILGVEYGGEIQIETTKEAGKAYYDQTTKYLYLCTETNTLNYADLTKYTAFSNLNLLNETNTIKTTVVGSISLAGATEIYLERKGDIATLNIDSGTAFDGRTTGQVLFVLPVGWRPKHNIHCALVPGAGQTQTVPMIIRPNGQAIFIGGGTLSQPKYGSIAYFIAD